MNSSPVRGKGCNIPAAFQKEKQIISDNRIIGSPCDGVRESSSAMAQVDLVRRHSTEIGFESIDRWKCGVESLVRGRTSPDASSQKCGVQSLVQSGVTPNASLGCGGDPLVRGRTNHDASFECGGDPLVQGRTNHDASLECGVHSPVQGGATPNASLECGGGSPVPSGATAPCKESVSFKFLRSQSTGVHVSPGRGDLSKKGQFGPSLRDRHRNSDLHCRTSDDEDPVFSVQDPGCVNETLIHGDSFGRRIEDSNVDINIASQGLEPAEGFAEDESGYVSSEAHNGSVDSIIKTPSSHSKLRRKRKASYHPMPLTSSPKHSTMTSELFIIPESPLGKELATETKEKKITSKTFPQQVHASNKSAICAMKEQSSHSKPIDLTVDLRMLNKNSINSQEPMIQNEAQKPGLKGNHLESKNMEVKQEVFSNRNNFTTSLWINPSENLENIPSALKLSDAVVVSDSDDFEEVTSCLRSPRLTGWRGRNRDGGKSKNGRPPTKKNKANEYEGDGSDNSILQELNIKGTTRNKKKETNNINKILKERRPASERGHMGVTDDKVSTWPGDDLEVSFDLILEENTLEQESMRPKIRLLRRRKSRTQGTQTSPETKSAVPEFPIEERQYFSRKGLAGTDIDASTWPKKVSARSREKRTEKPIKSRKSLSFHSEETPADEQENCFIQGAPGEQEEISTDPIHWVASHPTLPLVEFSPPRRGGIQHWNYKGEDGIRPEIESFRREESKLLIRDNSDSDIQVETDDEGMADPKMADFDLVNNMSCQIVPKNDDHPTKEPVEHKGLGCDASDIGQSVCGVDRSHKTNDENSMSTFTFYGAESSRKSQKVTNTLSEIIKNLRRKSWLQTPVQKKTSNLSIGNLKTMIKEAERRKRRNCVELGSARQADDVVVEGGGSIITLSDKLIEGTQGQRICMAKRSEARLINNQENNLFNGLATLGGSTIRDGDAQAPRRTRIGKRVVRTAPTAESLANKESGWNLAHTRVTLKGGPTKGLVVNGRCTQSTVRSRVTCSNIPGTSFSVDTFSCGEILGCKAYFLSHFHSHCYRGLTSTFVNTIYCSKVTGNLLRSKLGVRDDLIHRLPLHTVCLVEAIRVVLIEANHCPGSVMFLFLLDDGKRLLYTGDFRVDQSMLKNPHLTALRVDVCYLDTMHCQPDWEFPTRAEMQQFVQGVARKALKRNPRTLLVSGYQYLGHEALFMEVTGTQAAMSVDIYDTMLTLGMEELRSAVTLDFHSSQLHVLPLLQLGIKGLRTHWKKFMSRYDYILAFKPSGWPSLARRQALNGLQPCVTENIILYAIPFSEHSSYSELRHFVQWLRPQHLVPMVISPTQKSRLSTETTLASWLAEANESVRSHYQH